MQNWNKKKKDDRYDLKIFMVINAHSKYLYIFFIHDSMSIIIKQQIKKKR
jgi:hypothetical protein